MAKEISANPRKKIVLIGAGSVNFTIGLILDIVQYKTNNKWQVALVDIDEEALKSIYLLCKKIIEQKCADIKLSCSLNRKDILDGADYVISTIAVGGRRAWEQDVFIPRKYGIYQPVGDTSMPGGISRAMRMIPAMLEITKDIIQICPKAYFFNYSNPMTAICRAIRKMYDFPIIGLCHGVNNTVSFIAELVGVKKSSISIFSAGINHLTFIYDINGEGTNLIPIIEKRLIELRKEKDNNINKFLNDLFAWEIFEAYKAFPAPGDRHITEFFPERFPGGKYYGKILGIDAFSFENVIAQGDMIFKKIQNMALSSEKLPQELFDRQIGEHEQLIDIIDSIEKDERNMYSINIPNQGAIMSLPKDAIIEIQGQATTSGLYPMCCNNFPDILSSIISKHLSVIEITVEAALKGDKKLFVEAVLMGGYIYDKKIVDLMVDELIKEQIEYLPQFV